MTIVTKGVEPASKLLLSQRPQWLGQWGRFAADFTLADLPQEALARDPNLQKTYLGM